MVKVAERNGESETRNKDNRSNTNPKSGKVGNWPAKNPKQRWFARFSLALIMAK